MGQGGEVRGHQAAVSRVTSQIFHKSRSANCGNGRYGLERGHPAGLLWRPVSRAGADQICSHRVLRLMTHSGPQPRQNPALRHAPNALQNGTSLLGRPLRMPVTSRAALVPEFQGATHCALWITSKDFCRGLTAPNGGIRSASSIGTIVRSSAVVVGQRSERGVP